MSTSTQTPVILLGDTHGDVRYLFRALDKVLALAEYADELNRPTEILQLGDWGFTWPGHDRLPQVSEGLAERDLNMTFIEGNHDNYDWLRAAGAYEAEEPVVVAQRVTYIPRGVVTDVGGFTVLGFGGGVSIDRHRRIPGQSWWEEEYITRDDVARAIRNSIGSGVEVLASHDAPPSAELIEKLVSGRGYKIDALSVKSRDLMAELVQAVRPHTVVHGHYHFRYEGRYSTSKVHGLGCDGSGQEAALLIREIEAGRPLVNPLYLR